MTENQPAVRHDRTKAFPTTTRRRFAQVCAAGALGNSFLPRTAHASQPNPAIVKAMEAVMAAIPQAQADRNRPVYHFHPPAQWNNDPNGPIYYRGWYHLFYQHNPFDARWGHMHWGHARSPDLVNWEHLPIALWPSIEKGEKHVFSGGAISGPDGKPRLIYTSIGDRDPEQWLALPADDRLFTWDKYPGNPILTLKSHGSLKVYDWRDPFLFQEAGRTFMVTGGNLNPHGGYAAVQLYEASNADLTSWKHLGVLFRHPDRSVRNIECPNFFQLDGKWVLLVSPHRSVEYFVGDFDLAKRRFLPETHGILDPGDDYASNVMFDAQGTCILFLWGKTKTPAGMGWDNVITLPRILTVGEDHHVRQSPVPALETLHGDEIGLDNLVLDNQAIQPGEKIAGDCLEIQAVFDIRNAKSVGLRVRTSADRTRGTEIAYSPQSGLVTVGNQQMFAGRNKKLSLRVFLDKRVMEVYVNQGVCAMYKILEADARDLGVDAFATGGGATLQSIRAWPMTPASMNLRYFTLDAAAAE